MYCNFLFLSHCDNNTDQRTIYFLPLLRLDNAKILVFTFIELLKTSIKHQSYIYFKQITPHHKIGTASLVIHSTISKRKSTQKDHCLFKFLTIITYPLALFYKRINTLRIALWLQKKKLKNK